ncbi:sigma-54-dependent Fis family transcriptional regulator [Marinisporobacter balticus]|uniref:PAS domain S-box-containing protein n=1 Tax=Marinisporobacter balticus TaxID=2018667 RepID=A0A4R2KG31_9FIRM|nr:sigma 54-interacting transcriptional regulator [Marinisporobacter balticus]TCO72671.1 PAS domain S-box-containing protein [Marinisporobacter balticus]
MPGKKLLRKNEGFIKAWELFLSNGTIEKELIRDVISYSWMRSKLHGIDPLVSKIEDTLSNEAFDERYKNAMSFINTAMPFMNSLRKIVENTGFIVRLTDKDGYVLETIGDNKLVEEYGNLNVYKGCNVRENVIGTNALGTALEIGKPIQVLGAEHYCKQYHNWASSACPIRDEKKEIVGILSATGSNENVHPHTLGMVVAAAQAIEKKMKLEKINKQLDMANKHFYAIMQSISDGLICTDNKGMIMDINLFARRFLGLKEEDIVEKNIRTILEQKNYDKIMKRIHNRKKYEEEEILFKTQKGTNISCIVTVTPIKDQFTREVEGLVITFKEAKMVHSLVNKIVGAEARFTFDDILGKSKAIKKAIEIASLFANTNATILLLGESGTGKELFAQAIHNESSRRKKPFVFLNCGAIPRELVGSELFGYVEGAFTGAKRGGHPGKFELADGGTVFLDEIGDMPLDIQANLLRVLETKQIVRIGGHNVVPVDVRVIAATHKDLKKEVELGNFREDLFYRLNVMPIKTPSLRDRKDDIRIFTDHFIEKFSKRMGKEIEKVHESFYRGMMQYHWPGNVRELQNVVQLVVNIVNHEEVLDYKHLPNYMKSSNLPKRLGLVDELMSLEEIEKMAITKTMQEVNGNIALASKILGIGRSTLYRKIEKYALDMF